MFIEIEGTNLPGRRCHPTGAGESYGNIHVGLGLHQHPIDLFPGDAPTTRWRVEVRALRSDDGSFDFRGRFVHGPRGDRFLYLNWVNVGPDGSPHLFRRAKLTLTEIDPGLVERAVNTTGALVCTVNLTDPKGNPSCARFRPPDITWRVADGHESDDPPRRVEASDGAPADAPAPAQRPAGATGASGPELSGGTRVHRAGGSRHLPVPDA